MVGGIAIDFFIYTLRMRTCSLPFLASLTLTLTRTLLFARVLLALLAAYS